MRDLLLLYLLGLISLFLVSKKIKPILLAFLSGAAMALSGPSWNHLDVRFFMLGCVLQLFALYFQHRLK